MSAGTVRLFTPIARVFCHDEIADGDAEDCGDHGAGHPACHVNVVQRDLREEQRKGEHYADPRGRSPRLRRLEPLLAWRRAELVG